MITQLNDGDIIRLLSEARASPHSRARICFHRNELDQQQFMLICLLKPSKIGIHRHPIGKSESYVLLRGAMEVDVFDNQGSQINQIKLDEKSPFLFISGGTFHEPRSLTDYCMYFEAYPGPFQKQIDVEYLRD